MASPTSSPWLKRCVWITLGLLLGYLVVAVWIFPAVLRSQAERRFSALTGATARIRAVTFHPFAWRLRVSEFSLTDPAGLPLFACSNLVVDAQVSSLWRGEAYAREVLVEAPNLALRRARDGTIPWGQVLERLTSGHASNAPGSTRTGLPAFRVDWLLVRNGAISVDDQSTEVPFQAAFRPVNLSMKGITTRAGEEAAFECQATGDSGETMDWMGRLTVSPPGVTGLWRASRVPVAKPRPYTDEHSTMRPTAGLASWSLPYEFTWRDTGIEARVRGATLGLEGLAVVEKDDGSPFLELARFSVHNASLEWPERRVSVGAVEIEGPRLHARRVPAAAGARAAMNWRQLIDPVTVDEWVAFSAGWQLTLDRFSTDAGQVQFEDRTLDPPVRLEVDGVQARVVQLSNASNAAPATVEAGLRWNGKGEVRVT
ncbi:MAG: DUF748 domain-containing protein, partial [Verrucomicrobiales bacterium]|nr:DUF748 domain-containing protein [Verrucomicrobiales bacterium]